MKFRRAATLNLIGKIPKVTCSRQRPTRMGICAFGSRFNGDKTDNRVENLEWCTAAENQRHAVATGLAAQGEEHGSAKLTNEQARYIRDNPEGLTGVKLAEMFHVDENVISYIQIGKTYKHVGGTIRGKIGTRIPDETRAEIRRLYAQGGISQAALAKQFGINQATVLKIIHAARAAI